MVEFALIALVYFSITFAIFDAGRFIYNYNLLANAVRDGVRWTAVRGNTTLLANSFVSKHDIQLKISAFSQDLVPPTDIDCDPETNSDCDTPGVIIKIKSSPDQVCSENDCPWTEANAKPGSYVQVIAQMEFQPIIPLASITLRDSAAMQLYR